MVLALVEAGMDVARMNFSHGDYADHKAAYERVRAASDKTGRAVGVLGDLQGPKLRLGRFATGSTYWADGETVRITVADCEGTHDRVSTTYKRLAADAIIGDRVLVDDGKIGLWSTASRATTWSAPGHRRRPGQQQQGHLAARDERVRRRPCRARTSRISPSP